MAETAAEYPNRKPEAADNGVVVEKVIRLFKMVKMGICPRLENSQTQRTFYFRPMRSLSSVLIEPRGSSRAFSPTYTKPSAHSTVCFWNKAFGSTPYLVINVKRPLNIIDIRCDDGFFFFLFKAGAPSGVETEEEGVLVGDTFAFAYE